jgi:hypothetical protein
VETQTQQVRRIGSIDAISTVQVLHVVTRRLDLNGYRPVLPTDRPKLNQTFLRVEVQRYYLSATVNDPVGTAPGTRFVSLRKDHLTPEGLERLFRSDYDPKNPANNDVRWFTHKFPTR